MQKTGVQIPLESILFQNNEHFFFRWPTLVTLHNVHAWTSAKSTRGRRQGPRAWTNKICFTNVHFLRSPRVDHFEVHPWTSLSSREGQAREWVIYRMTKVLEVEGVKLIYDSRQGMKGLHGNLKHMHRGRNDGIYEGTTRNPTITLEMMKVEYLLFIVQLRNHLDT